MEVSERIHGTHTTWSSNGVLIAYIADGKLVIRSSPRPQIRSEFNTRIPPKEILSIRWSADGILALIFSGKLVELFHTEDPSFRVRIDNGSGGLGQFADVSFVTNTSILTISEFGKAKLWNINTGHGIDLPTVKVACDGPAWQLRPGTSPGLEQLAICSREGAEDELHMFLAASCLALEPVKLQTADVQSLDWSRDGRWLAVRDTAATAGPGVSFHMPTGQLFRSCSRPDNELGLAVKTVSWSGDSQQVAICKFDGRVDVLNARTFVRLGTLEHPTHISRHDLHVDARVFQEIVSAGNARSFSIAGLPTSPTLSRPRASNEPSELGVAEACFNCDGAWIATRDEQMLSTVWLWHTADYVTRAVIMQHSNVRALHWHPTLANLLLIDCGEGFCYLWNTHTPGEPPTVRSSGLLGCPGFSWLPTTPDGEQGQPAIIATTKTTFIILFLSGGLKKGVLSPPPAKNGQPHESDGQQDFEEGVTEDSLLEVLTGRKARPERPDKQSYTEQIDAEAEAFSNSEHLEDTFREKRKAGQDFVPELDPLDDSQIF